MSYGPRRNKTEMGSCTPRSQSARYEAREDAKKRSRKNRRRRDKIEARS